MSNKILCCPNCGATGAYWCQEHKVKDKSTKSGWSDLLVQDVCFQCDYQSIPYLKGDNTSKHFVVMNMPERQPKHFENKITNDEKITFTAKKGDMELNIKVGKEGFNKLLAMFMEGASL